VKDLVGKLVKALDDMRPRQPVWLAAWYWLDRWDEWRGRRRA
jgi:hypothetical protein